MNSRRDMIVIKQDVALPLEVSDCQMTCDSCTCVTSRKQSKFYKILTKKKRDLKLKVEGSLVLTFKKRQNYRYVAIH